MRIRLKCPCGAEFEADPIDVSERDMVSRQIGEWQERHAACISKPVVFANAEALVSESRAQGESK